MAALRGGGHARLGGVVIGPVEVLGMPVQAPLVAAGNVALAAEAFWLGRRLRARPAAAGAAWRAFFLALSGAALLGVAKHALGADGSTTAHVVRVGSNTFLVAAVAFAQLATIESWVRRPGLRDVLAVLVLVELLVFLPGAASPGFGGAMVGAVLGLLPVLLVEVAATLRGRTERGLIVAGLTVPIPGAALWVWSPELGPVSHVDVEHALVAVALPLLYAGLRRTAREEP